MIDYVSPSRPYTVHKIFCRRWVINNQNSTNFLCYQKIHIVEFLSIRLSFVNISAINKLSMQMKFSMVYILNIRTKFSMINVIHMDSKVFYDRYKSSMINTWIILLPTTWNELFIYKMNIKLYSCTHSCRYYILLQIENYCILFYYKLQNLICTCWGNPLSPALHKYNNIDPKWR